MQRTKAGRVALQFTATRDFLDKRPGCGAGTSFQRWLIPITMDPPAPRTQALCWPTGGGSPTDQLTSIRSRFSTGLGSIAVLEVMFQLGGRTREHSRAASFLDCASRLGFGGFGRCLIQPG